MKILLILPLIGAASFFHPLPALAQDTSAYISPSIPVAKGKAPGLTWKLLSDNKDAKEYVLVFAKGDEVLSGITDFAAQQHVAAARFTAIGALNEVTLGWFDPQHKLYKPNNIHQQMEMVSLIGDIAVYNGNPVVHAHCGVALQDGSMQGGHLFKAVTNPTVELFMTVFNTPLEKAVDKETGLKLIHPELK